MCKASIFLVSHLPDYSNVFFIQLNHRIHNLSLKKYSVDFIVHFVLFVDCVTTCTSCSKLRLLSCLHSFHQLSVESSFTGRTFDGSSQITQCLSANAGCIISLVVFPRILTEISASQIPSICMYSLNSQPAPGCSNGLATKTIIEFGERKENTTKYCPDRAFLNKPRQK